jgi:hypothetical protein
MRRLETLVNLAIVAPLGVGVTLVEDVPKAIARGRQEIVLARFIGKMVVTHGLQEAQRRFTHGDEVDVAGPTEAGHHAAVSVATAVTAVVEPAAAVMADVVGSADELVLPDYDHLPASHVVAKLASLDQAERDAIERYETAHRHRRTILGKLDQLRSA